MDTVTGTANNDVFNAGEAAGAAKTLTVGDSITGGAGTDTLNITQTAAFTGVPVGVTVSSVETVNVTSGDAVTINTASGFAGTTALNTTSTGNSTLTAATTTDITATVASPTGGGAAAINGGRNVTLAVTDAAVLGTASANTVTRTWLASQQSLTLPTLLAVLLTIASSSVILLLPLVLLRLCRTCPARPASLLRSTRRPRATL